MSFLRDSGGAALLQLLGAALQFGAGVAVARWLEPEGRGVFALVVLIPEIARAIAHSGFGTASTRITARDHSQSARVGINAISYGVLVGALFSGGLLAFSPQLLEFVQGEGFENAVAAAGGVEWGLFLSICTLPLLILEGYLGGQLIALGAVLTSNWAKVVQAGSFAVLLPVLFLTQEASVNMAVVARLLAFAVGNLFAFLALVKVWKGPRRPSLSLGKAAFLFGLRTIPASIALFLLFRIDVALVRLWRPMEDVGVYAVVATLGMMFQVVGYAVERALVPRIMSRSPDETRILTPLATRSFMLLGMPLAMVCGLLAWPGIPLVYGEGYASGVFPLMLILPGLVLGNVGQICNTDLIGRGHPGKASVSASVALAVNIGLNIWLIPKWGILGAATASLVCYSLHGLILAHLYARVAEIPMSSVFLPKSSDVGAIRALLSSKK